MRQAMRLNPLHPVWYWTMLGRALHFSGKHEEAIGAYERYPVPGASAFAYLAACHAWLGHASEARHFVAKALAARPDFSSGAWARVSGYPSPAVATGTPSSWMKAWLGPEPPTIGTICIGAP